jgi:hypothetical protein
MIEVRGGVSGQTTTQTTQTTAQTRTHEDNDGTAAAARKLAQSRQADAPAACMEREAAPHKVLQARGHFK